eukprot:4057837-Pleurochrysis_carterae.AAC.8
MARVASGLGPSWSKRKRQGRDERLTSMYVGVAGCGGRGLVHASTPCTNQHRACGFVQGVSVYVKK